MFNYRVIAHTILITGLIIFYQNCDGEFQQNTNNTSPSLTENITTRSESAPQPDSEPKLEVIKENEIIITKLNPTQIKIEWAQSKKTSSKLEFGLSKFNLNKKIVDETYTQNIHTFTLNDLKPNTEYFYKISSQTRDGYKFTSDVHVFKTQEKIKLFEQVIINDQSINIEVTSNSATVEWSISKASTAYIEYGLDNKLGSVQYKENSYINLHNHQIKNLLENTTYYYQIIAEDLEGKSYKSAISTFATEKAPKEVTNIYQANYVNFSQFTHKKNTVNKFRGPEFLKEGNWQGVNGSTSPGGKVKSWQRVVISPLKNNGAHRKLLLDTKIKEAWASYQIQLGTNWTPTDGVKLPGFSGHHNGGSYGAAGGNGGGWAGLCKSWSARTIISKPTSANSGLYRIYAYHKDNKNFQGNTKASDHPCINKKNIVPAQTGLRNFGQMIAGKHKITDNKWHTITHHVKLNDIGKSNGILELFIDGAPAGRATNLNFTNNPEYHNIAFWFTIYHGGSADTSGTNHDVFFHGFNWNAGPVNKTKIRFD